MKHKNKDVLVSVIIPVYNGSNYMKEAIDSAINQTYPNIEIIVVNDGSTDNGKTDRIAKSYGNKIRYFSKENGGVSSALNLGIKKMKGEYFSWLSHDDVYSPQKIESQINLLSKYDNNKLVALCGTQQIDKNSNKIADLKKESLIKENEIYNSDEALSFLFNKLQIYGCSLLIPKSVFCECGFFNESLKFSQDFLMWMNIFLNDYNLIYDSKKMVYNRIHDGQVTQTDRKSAYENSKVVYDLVIEKMIVKSNINYNFCYMYAKVRAIHNTLNIKEDIVNRNYCNGKITKFQVIKLKLYLFYGKVRPYIRVMYYRLFKHVKTKK